MISSGTAFPRGINPGHLHFRTDQGLYYRYLGDVPTNALNWVVFGGAVEGDPDTTGWTIRQDGASWFNKILNVLRMWDGSAVVTVGGSSPGGSSVQRWPYRFTGQDSINGSVNGIL